MKLEKAVAELEAAGRNMRFTRLVHICTCFFGAPRIHGSHHVFKMPWAGDPRINLQPGRGGLAKTGQARDVQRALERLLTDANGGDDD